MITVTITKSNKIIESIEVKGHANSGTYGNDLVCAAISAIITGGANALSDETNRLAFDIILKEGYALIEHKKEMPYKEEDIVKLDTIVTMLKTVEESNRRFIKIVEKEK